MSPEYRVEIVAPYVYKVRAENQEVAAKRAWKLYGDGDEGIDPLAPAEVMSVEELGPGCGQEQGGQRPETELPPAAVEIAPYRGGELVRRHAAPPRIVPDPRFPIRTDRL